MGRPRINKGIENRYALDIRNLKKHLIPSTRTQEIIHWTEGFFKVSIGLICYENNIELRYVFNEVKVIEKIPLVRTQCNFGGSRLWLLCPGCLCNRRALYSPGWNSGGFRCRVCQHLSYRSQRESKTLRMIGKWRKQKEKLEKKSGILLEACAKPKWMREATYLKKLLKIQEAKNSMSSCVQKEIERRITTTPPTPFQERSSIVYIKSCSPRFLTSPRFNL